MMMNSIVGGGALDAIAMSLSRQPPPSQASVVVSGIGGGGRSSLVSSSTSDLTAGQTGLGAAGPLGLGGGNGAEMNGSKLQQSSPSGNGVVLSTSPVEQKPSLWSLNNNHRIAATTVVELNGPSQQQQQLVDSQMDMADDAAESVSPSSSAQSSGGMQDGGPLSITADPGSLITDTGNGLSIQDATSTGGDAEGVWSSDIEQSFLEALSIYPPCGRRKIILSDEGKMYGRNELIARYIKIRTGKTRTRKQVSSHIQVLARKKQREIHSKIKQEHSSKERVNSMAALGQLSSAQIVSMNFHTSGLVAPNPAAPTPHSLYASALPFWNGGLTSMASGGGGIATSVSSLGGGELTPSNFGSPYASQQQQTNARLTSVTSSAPNFAPGGAFLPSLLHGSAIASTSAQTSLLAAAAGRNSAQTLQMQQPSGGGGSQSEQQMTIGGSRLKLCDFVAYVDHSTDEPDTRHCLAVIDRASCQAEPDPIDIALITDKFPHGRGDGLRDLYAKGPADAFYLVKFWADIQFVVPDEANAFYAVDSRYESSESMPITVSTKVCSFGKQVVEKVETEYACFDASIGRFAYRINKSPMCEYMVKFVHQLRKLNDPVLMNSVLDNFTALQLVTNKDTRETLLCVAFVFAVGLPGDDVALSSKVYRLIGGDTDDGGAEQ